MAATGAVVGLFGAIGAGPALAGAAQPNGALGHSTVARSPQVRSIAPSTYEWIVDGGAAATITLAAGNTFTSSLDGDAGTWVQSGKTAALTITGGTDASGGCIFAGQAKSRAISSAARPGQWVCPSFGSAGTFSIGPVSGRATAQAHGDVFARTGAVPAASRPVVLGTYTWTIDSSDSAPIALASNNTYTSTRTGNDSGNWVQGGSSVALTITGGPDGTGGCLFAGASNHTGTAIGTTAMPGSWVCPGYGSSGFFVIS